jgi:hypothetical protein
MKLKQGIVIAIVALSASACTLTTVTTTTVPAVNYSYYSGIYGYTPYSTTYGFSYGPGIGYSTRSWYGYSFGF